MFTLRRLPLLVPLCLATACADGAKENVPQSEVKITAVQHMFGLRSLAGFGTFPIRPTVAFPDRGRLNFFDDSRYTVARTGGTSSADRYALDRAGALSLFLTGSGREPSVIFRGGYWLPRTSEPSTVPVMYFTDRVSTPNSPSIGLYYGMRVGTDPVELEGAFHLLSIHAIFNGGVASPENVGRAAFGSVSIAAGTTGSNRAISGNGTEGRTASGTTSITFGGSIQNIVNGTTSDGDCNLTLNYGTDARICFAAATPNLVLALDADTADNEAGLIAMVRKFDTPALDPARVLGRFLVGGYTLFINPSNPGCDAFVGTVNLSTGNAFTMNAVDHLGRDFVYTGTWSATADGEMTFAINGTNETWKGAISRDYQTLLINDDFRELRSNSQIELNFVLGVRENPPPPPTTTATAL
jgi:hypothetical protein